MHLSDPGYEEFRSNISLFFRFIFHSSHLYRTTTWTVSPKTMDSTGILVVLDFLDITSILHPVQGLLHEWRDPENYWFAAIICGFRMLVFTWNQTHSLFALEILHYKIL